MTDRIGTFATTASLVLLSAFHMLGMPAYWMALPAGLFAAGVMRLVVVRPEHAPVNEDELEGLPIA